MTRVLGIVNVTRDSFSDGGRWLQPDAAIARSLQLVDDGADAIDLGAESTHPDAEEVPAAEEIARLVPVVDALVARGVVVSVDTHKPSVMTAMAERGVGWINDVQGFRSPAAVAAATACSAQLVVMFSRSTAARASRGGSAGVDVMAAASLFFAERIQALVAAGVARDRILLDPGMGFFLGPDAASSVAVLRRLGELRRFGLPLLVSVSRKSFLGAITGRVVGDRGPATLAAELFAARRCADWIRTHDVRALRDGLRVQAALGGAAGPGPPRARNVGDSEVAGSEMESSMGP